MARDTDHVNVLAPVRVGRANTFEAAKHNNHEKSGNAGIAAGESVVNQAKILGGTGKAAVSNNKIIKRLIGVRL